MSMSPPDQSVSGRQLLLRLADAFHTIGVTSHPENMRQIWASSSDHAKLLVSILEGLPRATVRPVIDCVRRLCEMSPDLRTSASGLQLCRVAMHLGTDPRSYREAVRTFRVMADMLDSDCHLDELVGRCLEVLEREHVLGLRSISRIARFLRSLDRRPGTLVLKGSCVSVADDDMDLTFLKNLLQELDHYSPLWGSRAATEVLHPDVQRYGAVDVPVPASLVPAESELLSPLPSPLTVPDPVSEVRPFLVVSGVAGHEDKDTMDALYLSMRIVDSIVQKMWMNRFRLHVVIQDGPGNHLRYHSGALHVPRGRFTPWDLVRQMAHAIDDQLFDGPGFASDHVSHPLASFASIVRPFMRSSAEDMASSSWDRWISRWFDGSLAHAVRSGHTTPRIEVCQEVGPSGLSEAEASGDERLLRMCSDSSSDVVDWSQIKDDFIQQELQRLLSNRHVFSRFFEQYARLYWHQLGRPYGPVSLPGDVDPHILAAHVSTFHEALLEAQVIDMGHIHDVFTQEYMETTLGAAGIAALLVGIGADMIRPS